MAAPVSPCAFPQSIGNPAACLASGEVGAAVVAAVVAGVVLGLPAALFVLPRLARWIGRRWGEFWRWSPPLPPLKRVVIAKTYAPTALKLLGFKHEKTRGQRLRSWLRELWPLWLRRCWRPLLAVVRRLLLPRG